MMIQTIPEGTKFGLWTTLGIIQIFNRHTNELCRCECGKVAFINGAALRRLTSGGCASCTRKEHGLCRTPTYESWQNMKARCENPHNGAYKNYGGRGITYCPEWRYFENFLRDMGVKPDGLEIDRIDNDGNSEPANCRWVTRSENQLNTCRSIKNRIQPI